jgi:Flp pilus assembly protein TadD
MRDARVAVCVLLLAACGGAASLGPRAPETCTPDDCKFEDFRGCVELCTALGRDAGMATPTHSAGDASTRGDAAADAGKPLVVDTPLPAPKPSTIPLARGVTEKADHELTLGDDSFEKSDWAQTKVHYEAARALAPKHPGPIVGLARLKLAMLGLALDFATAKGNKDVESVVKELRRAAQIDDAYGPAHVELGRALLLLGDADGALVSLSKGATLLPDQAEAHSALGIARLASGRPDDAVASLGRAAALDPGSAARHANYGTALMMRGRVADAVVEYRLALRIAPDDARAHSDLGTALLAQGHVVEAIAPLEEALRRDPNRATFHSNYGYALQIKGELARAEAEYRTALRIDPQLASAWINLATALSKDPKRRAEARAALEKARAIDPTDPRVKANLEELDALEKGH